MLAVLQESGVNPADYSRSLMATAQQYLEQCAALYPQPPSPSGSVMSTGEWLAGLPAPFGRAAASDSSNSSSSDSLLSTDAAAFELADAVLEQQRDEQQGSRQGSSSSSAGDWLGGATASSSADSSGADWEPRPAVVAALDVAHRSTQLPGSATACVLRLDGASGVLHAANLGDSGFLLVRQGALLFQSPAMQHFFDCPLQVSE